MNIRPIGDRVLIDPIKEESVTAGGLYLPEGAEGRSYRGVVKAAGPGTAKNPMTVKVGQTVLFSKYSGAPLKIGGQEFHLIALDNILAIEE